MADPLTAPIPDPELDKLEAMAVEHDVQASEELSAQEPETAQPAAEKEPPTDELTPDNSEVELEKPDRPRDALGRFTKTETGEDIPEAERKPVEPDKPAKQPSDYEAKRQEKARKEAERLDKTWQNVDLRKQELERREREIAEREQAVLQRQQQPIQQQQRDYSSRDLFQAAQDFKVRARQAFKRYQETGNESDLEAFNENDALAEQAEEHARQFYQVEAREAQQQQVQQYNQIWSGHMQKAIEADPDLVKADTPLAKAMHSLLETHGQVFWMIPDGFAKAVEIAKLRLEAGSASELRDKLTKAQKEVDRLTRATTPLGAGPTDRIQPKNFDSLTTDEQMAELERRAERADAEAFANA